jgi:two-component system cell cycle response regulator DivK
VLTRATLVRASLAVHRVPRPLVSRAGILSHGVSAMAMHLVPQSAQMDEVADKRSLVLAIDDDEDNLTLLSYALELLDCDFVGKTSGQEALLFAKEARPSLILLDVLLPDMHGLDVVHALKQDHCTCHIPIIAVTGLASSEDRTELMAAGCVSYLSKPYMVDELEDMVRHYLSLPAVSAPLVS